MVRRIPRTAARAPIPLFQHGLGWLLGSRVMMLEHRGRRTGTPRYAVLEVLERAPGRLLIVSGHGARSQWFRNISADPDVRIWTGHLRGERARAAVLPRAESRDRLERYRRTHASSAAALGAVLDIPELASSRPLPPDIAERLPLVLLQRVQT